LTRRSTSAVTAAKPPFARVSRPLDDVVVAFSLSAPPADDDDALARRGVARSPGASGINVIFIALARVFRARAPSRAPRVGAASVPRRAATALDAIARARSRRRRRFEE
jgi:hypothetical protein